MAMRVQVQWKKVIEKIIILTECYYAQSLAAQFLKETTINASHREFGS